MRKSPLRITGSLALALFIILSLTGFKKPENIDPGRNYYREGMDAWKIKRNIPLALSSLRLSFFQKPDSYRLYWYMYFLMVQKEYDEIIAVLEETPKETWHPCAYETYIYRYYAEALKNRGRRDDAVKALIEALDKKDKFRERNLIPLIRYWFAYPNLATSFRAHPRYEEIMREMIAEMGRDWKALDPSHRRTLYDFCIVSAAVETQRGKHDLADLFTGTAIAATDGFPDDREQHIHALFYRDAMQYWRQNYERQKDSAYDFRFICHYYRSIDALLVKNGKKVRRRHTMDDDFINTMIDENRENSLVAAMAYFYLFRGQVLMSFDYQVVDATIREVDGWKIVYDMVDPHPGRIFFNAYDKYDGFMSFYDVEVPSQFMGGPSALMFQPYSLYSVNWRFRTYMLTGAGYSVYIHEIFHNIESYYKIGPGHGYLTERKSSWPGWYRETVTREGTNAQLSYMRGRFEHDIIPAGTGIMRLRENAPSFITPEAYEAFDKKYRKVPFNRVRESGILFRQAQDLYNKNSFSRAADLYRKAFSLNPCNQAALRQLAYTLHWKLKKEEESVALYKKYLEQFDGLPFTGEALHRVLWYSYGKKDYAAIINLSKRYGYAVRDAGTRAMMLYYRGASLNRTGSSSAAIPVLEEALKMDLLWQDRIAAELEDCRKKAGTE